MKPMIACVAVLLCLASPVLAQVKTSEITLKSGDEEFKAFVAQPEGKGPFPAVVVIQEWWGLNDWIKDNARRIAAKGYVAIAPDLYHGKVAEDMKTASTLMNGLDKSRAVKDLKTAVTAAAAMPNVNKDKIGSIGWCMGGGYSLQLALNDDRIHACVICYGRVVTDPTMLKSLKAPVLGIFGEKDKGIKAADVREFEKALKEAGGTSEKINIYADAGHGFMRTMNPGSKENPEYRDSAAKDAWTQIDGFFAKTLAK
jgi:carboxymethylenebutenolidase